MQLIEFDCNKKVKASLICMVQNFIRLFLSHCHHQNAKTNELNLNLFTKILCSIERNQKNLISIGIRTHARPTSDVSPAQWLRQVFTGDTALTTRPSQSDAGGAEFLVYILRL